MDEDAGNRTPPRARSPDAHSLAARLPPSRFAVEAAAKSGAGPAATAPVTPAAPKALSVSFVSPLTTGGEDSLPASFDSMSLNDSPDGPASVAAASSFAGPLSYAPSARGPGSKPAQRSGGRTRKLRSRRKLAIGSRLLKLTTQVGPRPHLLACLWRLPLLQLAATASALRRCCCLCSPGLAATRGCIACTPPLLTGSPPPPPSPQNYPPLVEARAAGGTTMSALAVFRDLSEEQWERFMGSVRRQMARKLADGAWKQAAAAQAPPMMSCPRF